MSRTILVIEDDRDIAHLVALAPSDPAHMTCIDCEFSTSTKTPYPWAYSSCSWPRSTCCIKPESCA